MPADNAKRKRPGFMEDFKRFFLRGLAALLPTLITLWLLVWTWNFLWEALGRHIIWGIKKSWESLGVWGLVEHQPAGYIDRVFDVQWSPWAVQLLGVGLAIILVYVIGLLVGNFIGRAAWRLAELAVMRIPLVRAIYPAVKQVTDFLLADRTSQFRSSRVVAVQPHEKGIWSVGLITGSGLKPLTEKVGEEMVTVFVPSSPTAFSGYVLVVPRQSVVELPISVEDALRMLVSGGVLSPGEAKRPQVLPGGAESDTLAGAGLAKLRAVIEDISRKRD